ncbi:MAG: hypothetical protein U5K70_00355 [Halodesulfurarchaeum sp.]|nr:hypothetical protein [Halodesulfurarchaeum sp.]
MPERRTIDDRLSALERRLDERGTSGEEPPRVTAAESAGGSGKSGGADTAELVERVETLEAEIAELEAGLRALRGYVGNVEHVNESVERRANAAIAAVERLESAPKTPPPIATATPGGEASKDVSGQRAHSTGSAEATETEPAETGIFDRLKALR